MVVGALAASTASASAHEATCLRRPATLTACLIDRERAERGLPPLSWQPQLARMARRQSRTMVVERFFAHVTPAGAGLARRVAASGYLCGAAGWRVGEALAWRLAPHDTPADAVAAWLASPRHRRLLLDRRFREVGVGVAAGAPTTEGSAATYTVELGTRWDRRRCRRGPRRAGTGPARPSKHRVGGTHEERKLGA